MTPVRPVLLLLLAALCFAQAPPGPDPTADIYMCPMDPDVRSHAPGTCPRCGMKLTSHIPEPAEYHVDLSISPKAVKPGQPADLTFTITDPWKDRPVANFLEVHEKLFHLFVVSQDLNFFLHEHPVKQNDGTFRYSTTFPRPGLYRILSDFYPDGGTPQLIPKTVLLPGQPMAMPKLARDYAAKTTENLEISLDTEPAQPIAGMRAQLHFTLKPGDKLEKLLGAWGHMLVASDDLIDTLHEHPFIADGGPQIQFNVVFPRPRPYRVWVQFQRDGKINTAHFDIPVQDLQ